MICGAGIGMVLNLVPREGGLDLSSEGLGGYVACQSASVTGIRGGLGMVAELDSGEGGR